MMPPNGHSSSSPPESTSSTVPIAELVKEAPRVDRCVYFTPPMDPKCGTGLRRFFFGDSPQLSRPTAAKRRTNESLEEEVLPLRASRSLLARRTSAGLMAAIGAPLSHSSCTVSVDFDSEESNGYSASSGTTAPAEELRKKRQKCNGSARPSRRPDQNGHHRQAADSPLMPSAHRHHNGNTFSGAQFDTQSMQSRSTYGGLRKRDPSSLAPQSSSISGQMSRAISLPPRRLICSNSRADPHHLLGKGKKAGNWVTQPESHGTHTLPLAAHHRSVQQPQPVVRCGSCTNLSVLNGSAGRRGDELVLYDGGHSPASRRHSMALIEAQMPVPVWYQPMLPPPPPPPPPFYYTATTLPHPRPPPPMDLATFRRAMKESERFEKKNRKMLFGEDDALGSACWEFCCGGSALLLWLVITLISLGFLGFLLLAIYFL